MPTPGTARSTIVVLDYGSQYAQLIVRRVRECHVYAEMLPWDASESDIDRLNPAGIILSGGRTASMTPVRPICASMFSSATSRFWDSATACS